MVTSEVFDTSIRTVCASQTLCHQSRATRGMSRTIRGQVAVRTSVSASPVPARSPASRQELQSAGSPPDANGVDKADDLIRRRFGPGLGVAYTLEGLLSGHYVGAALDDEGNLRCDDVLWAHAEILAAIGENISFGDAGNTLTAGLASPVQALVTFMYCVRVTNFEVSLDREMVASVMQGCLPVARPQDDRPSDVSRGYGLHRYSRGRARSVGARRGGRRGPGRYPRGAPPTGGPPPL